jgi:hypothetical protein
VALARELCRAIAMYRRTTAVGWWGFSSAKRGGFTLPAGLRIANTHERRMKELAMVEERKNQAGLAPLDALELDQAIRLRAYEIYLQRSGGPGNALSDWLDAERQIIAEEQMKRMRQPFHAPRRVAPSISEDAVPTPSAVPAHAITPMRPRPDRHPVPEAAEAYRPDRLRNTAAALRAAARHLAVRFQAPAPSLPPLQRLART